MVDILPISTSKNPRRSLTSQFDMARTKSQEKSRKANELAAVAQCMDGYLRDTNQKLEKKIKFLQLEFKRAMNMERQRADGFRRIQAQRHMETLRLQENTYVSMLIRRQRRIQELESQWEDLSQTLFDAIEENEKLKKKNVVLEEQLLDCTCFEKETLSDNDTE